MIQNNSIHARRQMIGRTFSKIGGSGIGPRMPQNSASRAKGNH